jgi:hypothetical protein
MSSREVALSQILASRHKSAGIDSMQIETLETGDSSAHFLYLYAHSENVGRTIRA